MKTIEQLEAEAKSARQVANDVGGTDENLNKLAEEAEKLLADAKGTDYEKRLEDLKNNLPPQKSEKEKAKYTVERILERHPDLKQDFQINNVSDNDDPIVNLESKLLRTQAEGIVRSKTTNESEVKYIMHFYDHKIVKTGNLYADVDDAIWLARKDSTRNALDEMHRNPNPGIGIGAGQKPPMDDVPQLTPEDVRRFTQAGMKQTSPGVWEGTKVKVEWDKKAKKWNQTFK